MKADVAIVIVSYNSAEFIGECLESLLSQRDHVSQQVIVVDNASKDNTVGFIRENFPEVELVVPGKNLGFAAGVNLGASHADAEFVLLLNPDTVILNHAVDVIVDFARANPGHGLYGGRTLKPDGSLEPSSCWGQPTLWSMAMFAFGLTALARQNPLLDPESLGRWKRDTVKEVGVITGCFLLSPKAVWDELEGMDERYFMYGEDVDFAMRARAAGYRPLLCPKAELIHEVGLCSETPVHKTLLLYRGKASLVRIHWRGPAKYLGLFFLTVGTGLRAALSTLVAWLRGSPAEARWQTLWRERRTWICGYPSHPSRPTVSAEGAALHP
jgi:GT2 family glycosyltransferase